MMARYPVIWFCYARWFGKAVHGWMEDAPVVREWDCLIDPQLWAVLFCQAQACSVEDRNGRPRS
jgi:hypothetical protein